MRQEQAEQTKRRLVTTLIELMGDETVTDVSVAEVARRAGVSVRTAYRYFPTKEDLLDAAATKGAFARGSPVDDPRDAADLPRFVAELLDAYTSNEPTLRAHRWSKPAAELRARRKANQIKVAAKILSPLTRHLDAERAREVIAVIQSLFASINWLELRTHWGLEPEQAKRATLWAVETLLARLIKESKKK